MQNKIKKVFVVEDEKTLSQALELKLTHAGFQVRTAVNGETAEKVLEDETFDVVMLDLVMSKVNGFDVLKFIKSKDIKVPVIVLSNLAQDEDIQRVYSLGATKYFVKSDTSLAEIVSFLEKL